MPKIPNRSDDIAPATEAVRKHRGTDKVTKGQSGNVTIPEPNEDWGKPARMMWDAMLDSGQTEWFEASDYATLWLVCDQIEHLYQQGGRRSPEFLRVITTTLGSLMATEGDRRKLRVELDKPDPSGSDVAGDVVKLFESYAEKEANA